MLRTRPEWSRNNQRVHQTPAQPIQDFYPDYQHISASHAPAHFMSISFTYRTNCESNPFFSKIRKRPQVVSSPTVPTPLLAFRNFYEQKEVHKAHFQLHNTFRMAGEQLALFTTATSIRALDLASGRSQPLYHAQASKCLDFAPKQSLLCGTSEDRVFVHNLATQRGLPGLRFFANDEHVGRMAFLRGRGPLTLGVVGNERRLFLWDAEAQKMKEQLGCSEYGNDLDFDPDLNLLAVAEDGVDIELLDPRAQAAAGRLRGHQDYNFGVRFTEEHRLTTCGQDMTVRVWDLRCPAEELFIFAMEKAGAYALEYSSKHRRLFAAESCSFVHCFDFSRAEVRCDKLGFLGFPSGMALSPSQNKLCFSTYNIGCGVFELDLLNTEDEEECGKSDVKNKLVLDNN